MQDNFETSSLERQAADPANKRFQTQERGALNSLKRFLMMYVFRISERDRSSSVSKMKTGGIKQGFISMKKI